VDERVFIPEAIHNVELTEVRPLCLGPKVQSEFTDSICVLVVNPCDHNILVRHALNVPRASFMLEVVQRQLDIGQQGDHQDTRKGFPFLILYCSWICLLGGQIMALANTLVHSLLLSAFLTYQLCGSMRTSSMDPWPVCAFWYQR
jgi:hypothetical protein